MFRLKEHPVIDYSHRYHLCYDADGKTITCPNMPVPAYFTSAYLGTCMNDYDRFPPLNLINFAVTQLAGRVVGISPLIFSLLAIIAHFAFVTLSKFTWGFTGIKGTGMTYRLGFAPL